MDSGTQQSNIDGCPATIRRDDLTADRRIERRVGRNRTKASLTRYRLDGGDVAVKDYAECGWGATTYGRWLIGRECRAYRRAADCPGIPRFLGRIDADALALGWIDARPLAEFQVGEVSADCFDEIRTILDSLHSRGIALADLSYRDILIDGDGRPWIVDLAASWLRERRPRAIHVRLFRHFAACDRFALDRLQLRYCGGDMQQILRAADPGVVRWHRRARRLKWRWDRLRGATRLPPVDDHWR